MKLTVAIHGFDTATAEKVHFGDIVFDGKKITTSSDRMLRMIATEPIILPGGERVRPDEAPERFMRNLHLQYHGSYCWALEAVESPTEEGMRATP